tara:strand:+ start:266 stop:451 length:186 start_codon:yes stop_codon:yes gene_type:complete
MKVGDLVYMTKSMLEMRYPEMGIVVGMKGKHYVVGFPNGIVQPFHPKWVRDTPLKRRNNGK